MTRTETLKEWQGRTGRQPINKAGTQYLQHFKRNEDGTISQDADTQALFRLKDARVISTASGPSFYIHKLENHDARVCPECAGSGTADPFPMNDCSECGGTGETL